MDPFVTQVSIGHGPGRGMAWGCDLSYDYVKINAECEMPAGGVVESGLGWRCILS